MRARGEPRPGTTGGVGQVRAVENTGDKGQQYNIVHIGEGEQRNGLLKSVDETGSWNGIVYLTPFHAQVNAKPLLTVQDVSEEPMAITESLLPDINYQYEKGQLNLSWRKEKPEAESYLDRLLFAALEQAEADYDRAEHRTYNAYLDPEFRQINAGDWKAAGYDDLEAAVKAFFYKMALTGRSAPSPDPENLKNSIQNSQFWNHLETAQQQQLQHKYYEETAAQPVAYLRPDLETALNESQSQKNCLL